ncbi:unnamed protein product [Aphanomyces euteiches]|uniref:Kinesin motor domain-containing protein n=1 Tax=Aphanomyces euteiches TaxID=100861 RepID=A0A6G0X2I7_9STRA|nr:hypothetical protein Ae201684_009170 [Aphanomyces euteiches]KAH9070513.1 hypothetical protein Ae201684P_002870 [Aphanomyces euteiches]
MEESIDVCIRVRPLNERESRNKDVSVLRTIPSMNVISVTDRNGTPLPGAGSVFQYDHIFPENVPTRTIYDEVAKRIVYSTLQGINGTIFAYGQTSSGKTYTMQGDVQSELGILPLAVEHIFQYIEQSTDRDFLIRVSYVEIYNEVIRDLLSDDKEKSQNLKIREDPKKGIYLESHEEIITDYDSIMQLLEQGEQRRTVGQTAMNERSSRSHSIFRIVIESKEKSTSLLHSSEEDVNGAVVVGVLNLVDLAGSESVRYTAAEGVRQREAGNINRSLLTLSRVINSLAQGTESIQNAPFRDSKLTRLLQSSLAGSTRTLIVCCVTPSDRHLEETKGTLQFAARAKNIQLSACVNEVLDDQAQLKRLKRELNELRKQVDNNEMLNALKAENEALAHVKTKHEAEILRLMSLIVTSSSTTPLKKPKAKRGRETWGPGDIMSSLLRRPVALDDDDFREAAQFKRKKERHSEGSAIDTQRQSECEAKVNAHSVAQDCPKICGSCGDAHQTVKDFEALLLQMEKDRTRLQEQVANLELQLQLNQEERSDLLQRLDHADKASSAFEEILEETEKSRNEAIEQMMQIETQQSELQVQLADQMKRTEAAEEMVLALDEKCKRYERTIKALEDSGSDDGEESRKLRQMYESKLQALEEPHRADFNKWSAKQTEWENTMSKLRNDMQEESISLQMANTTMEEQARLSKEAYEALQTTYDECRNDVEKLESILKSKEAEWLKSHEDLVEAKTQVEALHSDLLVKCESLEESNKSLNGKLDEFVNAEQQWANQLNDYEVQNKSLQIQIASLVSEKSRLEELNQDLSTHNEELTAKATLENTTIIAQLEEQLASSVVQRNDLEAQLNVLALAKDEHINRIEAMTIAMQSEEIMHKKLMEDVQDQLFKANVEKHQIENILENLSSEHKALQERLSRININEDSLDRQHQDAELRDLRSENIRLAARAEELEIMVSKLQEQAVEKDKLESIVQELENEMKVLKLKHDQLLQELNSKSGSDSDMELMRQEISEVQDKWKSLTDEHQKKMAENVQLQEKVHDLEGELNTILSKFNVKIQDHTKLLEGQVNGLKNERLDLEAKVEQLYAELESRASSEAKTHQAELDSVRNELQAEMNEKQLLEEKLMDMEERMRKMNEHGSADSSNLRAELLTLKNDLDAQLEEKEALYDKIDDLEKRAYQAEQNAREELHMRSHQWETERETLKDQIDAQHDRIKKLELVKMTKHHLEVFQKMKLDNKKKSEEILMLRQKMEHSSNNGVQIQLIQEQLKHEQAEVEHSRTQMAELKLELKTAQNECNIKASEVLSLQTTISQYQELTASLQRQVQTHDQSYSEINDLRSQIQNYHNRMGNQAKEMEAQKEILHEYQCQLDEQSRQLQELTSQLDEKKRLLESNHLDVDSKMQDLQMKNEELHEKYKADLAYLEKENLELHLELKQTKRMLMEKEASDTPMTRTNLQDIQNLPRTSDVSKQLSAKKSPSVFPMTPGSNKENDPEAIEQRPECNQQ